MTMPDEKFCALCGDPASTQCPICKKWFCNYYSEGKGSDFHVHLKTHTKDELKASGVFK